MVTRRSAGGQRRGGIYIAVLGAAMVVSLIGMAALATLRSQRATVTTSANAVKARLYAESAVELAIQMIAADPNWRQNQVSGVWLNNRAIDDGSLSVSVTDPVDGNLGNRDYDPVVVRGTGVRGGATQIVQVTLLPTGTPLDALGMALHTAGELHINGSTILTVSGAPASTNGTLRVDGTVAGNAQCLAAIGSGNVTGTLTQGAPAKPMPGAGVEAMYVNLGTAISPGNTIDRVALGPGYNPWGGDEPDGVYVLTTNSNVTIRRCRILGTLVIVCPGKKVTIQDNVLMQPARADYPTLIVDGDLDLTIDSSTNLSESSEGKNFNPAGVPYLGAVDADTADSYPSEIGGLIHVKGQLGFTQTTCTVRGCVICESVAASNAVVVPKSAQIIYVPALFTSPPMGYTKSVTMSIQPGSWTQVVLP